MNQSAIAELERPDAIAEIKSLLVQTKWHEAERHIQAMLAEQPNDPQVLVLLAQLFHGKGEREESVAVIDRVLGEHPDVAEAYVRKAIYHLSLKEIPEAYEAAARAVALKPDLPEAQIVLGGALAARSQFPDAMAAYDKAIALDPNAAEAYARKALIFLATKQADAALKAMDSALTLGANQTSIHEIQAIILQQMGKKAEAEQAIIRALEINPKHVPSLMRYAAMLLEKNELDAANACYDTVLAEQRGHGEAWFRKSLIFHSRTQLVDAWNCLAKSIFANASARQPRHHYAAIARSIRMVSFSKEHAFSIMACMDDPDISNQYLALPWLRMVTSDLSMIRYQEVYGADDFTQAARVLDRVRWDSVFSHPFILKGITHLIVPDYQHERMMGYLRRYALENHGEQLSDWGWEPLLTAQACHHFLVEYVCFETAEEKVTLVELAATLSASSPLTAILTYGCYRMLADLPDAEAISARLHATGDAALQWLATVQIDEVLEERRIKLTIPMIGHFANEVSQNVGNMYEENPYPRWAKVSRSTPFDFSELARSVFPVLRQETIPSPNPLKVLIPGCGTGKQSVNAAITYKNAEVLAVDLSRSSLSYAIRSTQKHGFTNITYRQADLLELPKNLDEQFDFIECTGVLHHLREPKDGFKALLSLLKPEGYLCVALYSEIARHMVVASRDFIAEHGYEATPDGIRACRKALFELPDDHPTHIITQGSDFFTMSTCRDLIFHIQEHRITLPQLGELLDELGLEFLGFFGMQNLLIQAYKEMFPEDVNLNNLKNWHEFEVKTPIAFASMYQFWVRRKRTV